MSILSQKRTTQDYKNWIQTEPPKTIENKMLTVRSFAEYCKQKHKLTPEEICSSLLDIKKSKGEQEYQDSLYDILQDWINWNTFRGLGARTIRSRFSFLRGYLYYLGIKTDSQDIKQLLKFPKKFKEERYPLQKTELRDLVNAQGRYPKRQALYLACSSSGMRIGEALKIRKKDLDFSKSRIIVRIKPEYTKTREGRTTFLSNECKEKMNSYIEKLGSEDLVFTNSKSNDSYGIENTALARALQRLGLVKKYQSNKFNTITTHSFRAYFFTHAARKHGENYAHKLTGHGGYLLQPYDRQTEDEKLEKYIQLESELVVFDQTKNEMEIKKLQREVQRTDELEDKIQKLQEIIADQDKKFIEKLQQQGILPKY